MSFQKVRNDLKYLRMNKIHINCQIPVCSWQDPKLHLSLNGYCPFLIWMIEVFQRRKSLKHSEIKKSHKDLSIPSVVCLFS